MTSRIAKVGAVALAAALLIPALLSTAPVAAGGRQIVVQNGDTIYVPPGVTAYTILGGQTPPPSPTPVPTVAPTLAATPAPTVTPAPTFAGIPPIPAGQGSVFRWSGANGVLAPFRVLTYPNSHPGDLTIQYGAFVGTGISVHDGYLAELATRNANGTWAQSFVGTGLNGDGSPAPFSFQYGTACAMARTIGSGPGDWVSLWYYNVTWGSPEIDWTELIGGKWTANLHGSGSDGQKAAITVPAGWHESCVTKHQGVVSFSFDGTVVAQSAVNSTMDAAHMALLADAKVGLTAPTSSTSSPLELDIAWWTVDP